MLKVASIIGVILLGTSISCRSAPSSSVGDYRGGNRVVQSTPVTTVEKPWSEVSPAAFVHPAQEVDEPTTNDEPAEMLPSQRPNAREPDTVAHKRLTLSDLESIALRNNPTLAAAAARLEAARGRQLQAGLYPNPVVGYHATEVGNLGTAGQQGGFIGQRFITGGKRQLDQAIAAKEIDEAHFLFHAQQQRVRSDVQVRFYDALVAQRRLDLTKKLARIGDDLVKATETLLAGRLGTENDLLQAQIRAEESQILYDNAGNEHVEAWRRLAAVTGVPTITMTPLDGDLEDHLPEFDWDECYAMVLGSNRQLNATRARVERATIAIRRARKEPIPNVDLSVSVRHHNVTQDDVANVQVGIPIPIFNKNQGNIRAARADWMAACREVERLELDLQDRLAVAYRRYANARQQVERYSQRMIQRAARSLELVTDGYEKGQVNYLTLLTAQQTYLQVNLSYLESLREIRASSAVIEGQLLSGSLREKIES